MNPLTLTAICGIIAGFSAASLVWLSKCGRLKDYVQSAGAALNDERAEHAITWFELDAIRRQRSNNSRKGNATRKARVMAAQIERTDSAVQS